jgi:hypothetical protein
LNKKDKKIKIDIRTINNVDEIYTKNNTQIKNKLYKNINNKIIYDFFSDEVIVIIIFQNLN